jgi:DNA polymerase-2
MRSAEIAQKYGCKVIHGIVDSIWVKDNQNRPTEEFEQITRKIAGEISDTTSIPMSWEGRFNVITFLPSKAEPDVPALSHYWGIKSNGEIKVRGIEVRRRDMPKIVKDAQYALIDVFQGAETVDEFINRIPIAKKVLFSYIDQVETGNISREELSIRQRISRKPSDYKVNSYQAVAARQLERSGEVVTPGKNVRYIILNAEADPDFPEKKVILTDLYDKNKHQYDKKKYVELLKRAFENIFPYKFPELDELVSEKIFRKSNQQDLSCFID